MSYAANNTPNFLLIAQELGSNRGQKANSVFSDGSELIPAEVRSQMQRQGRSAFRRPELNGATVDQEGLTNNYGVEPNMYFATFPTTEQARRYTLQALAAAAFVVGLILTSAVVS